jgi:HSP20 family molecular chaperone IbpA
MKWRDPTLSIWSDALDLLERADRLHRQFFQVEQHRDRAPTWEPPIDMLETERMLLIIVALPGVAPDQLVVAIEGGALVVRGRRAMPALRETAAIRRLEIPHGRFERRIVLPEGQFQLEKRQLQDGCLILTLYRIG